jgi:hypothetical protein
MVVWIGHLKEIVSISSETARIRICPHYFISKTSLKVRHHWIITQIFTSSLEVIFSTYNGNQNRHTEDIGEHTGLFFHTITYSKYAVPWKTFQKARVLRIIVWNSRLLSFCSKTGYRFQDFCGISYTDFTMFYFPFIKQGTVCALRNFTKKKCKLGKQKP